MRRRIPGKTQSSLDLVPAVVAFHAQQPPGPPPAEAPLEGRGQQAAQVGPHGAGLGAAELEVADARAEARGRAQEPVLLQAVAAHVDAAEVQREHLPEPRLRQQGPHRDDGRLLGQALQPPALRDALAHGPEVERREELRRRRCAAQGAARWGSAEHLVLLQEGQDADATLVRQDAEEPAHSPGGPSRALHRHPRGCGTGADRALRGHLRRRGAGADRAL
mmetsp:Transcript_35164/g.98249  ORF Transcript_35164/g.98249 Transcript_35164/m.98249 type:complete len:220 (+) Transcript_35164:145-804(+)